MDSLRNKRNLWVGLVFGAGILIYLAQTQFGYRPAQFWRKPCECHCCNRSRCVAGNDTASYNDTEIDMLDALRADGFNPRLLSQAVRRPVGTDTSHVVPNVVHYVLYDVPRGVRFDFQHYLSFRSVGRFLKPQYIFLHGNVVPKTDWWNRTIGEVDNIYHVYRKKRTHINSKRVSFVQHLADFTRLIVTIDYGGIYLDTDTLILKSLDPLRVHALTLGVSGPNEISNGIIIAQKNALFLRLWKENYKNYVPSIWGHNSVTFGHKLYRLFPHLVHVEKEHLLRPTWKDPHLMYSLHGEFYNWSQSYSFHVSGEGKFRVPTNVEQLNGYNNTLGEVMRYIYFGSRKLLPVKGAPFTPN